MTKKRMTTMELCRRRPGSRQEGTVEETVVNTPLTVTGTITDIHTKTGQTMTGKAGVKDVPADHLTEKDATLTDEKEIMQTAEKDPEAKETAKAVPLKEEALPEHPAETEHPTEIMLRMTEEAVDTARAAAPGNEGMQEREADPAMQIRRIMKTMIVLMSRKTGTAMKILKNCSRKDAGWIGDDGTDTADAALPCKNRGILAGADCGLCQRTACKNFRAVSP